MAPNVWMQHKNGRMHAKEARLHRISGEVEPETDLPEEIQKTHQYCSTCQIHISHGDWSAHANGRRHKRGQEYIAYTMAQNEAEKDKNDVGIQGDLDFSIVEPNVAKQGVTKSIEVRLTAPLTKVTLVSVQLSANIGSSRKRIQSPYVLSPPT
ncbi:hypothetical protein P691DRAFT_686382 [Macrolepiota fuliginosa MF-IS2]|uniref:U1-type domain-containing protein n=1 Tax=Macrolepiota fuliginosa MF-IS2 TaxID=1400762 RepID=A0A9P6BWK0_9AGAR|nr:hypothetical protein P691DRAFT_686382 [Macrolepiota fuliginosa MF-IS2]